MKNPSSRGALTWRGVLTRLAISAGSLVVFFIGLDLVLRFWLSDPHKVPGGIQGPNYQGISRPSSDPLLAKELIPGANGVVNASGYMGTDYPPERSPGTFRIVGLGDSITMYFSAERENYLYIAEQILRREPGAPRAEALNFGVGAYDTSMEVHQFETRGSRYRPDLVTVGYCINDGIDFPYTVNRATNRVTFAAEDSDSPPVFSFIERNLATARADLTAEQFFRVAFASAAWNNSMRALERLAALGREQHFAVVVLIFPVITDFDHYLFAPYHERVRAVATSLGMTVLDLLPAFRAAGASGSLRQGRDYIHPNAIGHRAAGEALARTILQAGLLGPGGRAPLSDGGVEGAAAIP